MFLKCASCGHETPGWKLPNRRPVAKAGDAGTPRAGDRQWSTTSNASRSRDGQSENRRSIVPGKTARYHCRPLPYTERLSRAVINSTPAGRAPTLRVEAADPALRSTTDDRRRQLLVARSRARDRDRRSRRRRPRAHRRRLGPRPSARARVEGRRHRGVRRAVRSASDRCSNGSDGSKRSARAFRSSRWATSTCRCPAASRSRAAVTAAST